MAPQARRLLNIGRRNDEINVACESLLRPSCPPRPLTLSVWRLCLSKIKSGHIGGAARREWGDRESARPVRRHARLAHPSPRIDACGRRYNISCTTAVGDGGGSRRTPRRGRGILVGSNRSVVRHIRFAMGNAAASADRECPLTEVVG